MSGADCLNCGALVAREFCTSCGQSRHDHSRSLLTFLHEALEHLFLLDMKTLRTLWALLSKPGHLTLAFAEGRRVRYVTPFRLYLFASFTFFLALWLSGFALLQFKPFAPDAAATGLEFMAPIRAGQKLPDSIAQKIHVQGTIDASDTRLVAGFETALEHPKLFNAVFDEWLPRVLVLLLPALAVTLALFKRRDRRLFFADHIAFVLHAQSFAFIIALAALLAKLSQPDLVVGWPLLAAIILYGALAYRRVYRSSWLGTLIKATIIGTIYTGMLGLTLAGLLLYTFWEVPA